MISSDPTVLFSDRLATAKGRLRGEINECGLGHIADDIDTLATISIRFNTTAVFERELQPRSSKLGGVPELPEGMAWPKCSGIPMALLAQICMCDVAPYDPDGRLPQSGMLYFFYEARRQTWGYDPKDRGNWKVIYYNGDLAHLRHVEPPHGLPGHCRFRPCKLSLHSELTLPSLDSRCVERLELSEKERSRFLDLLAVVGDYGETTHRMLGHPDQVQGEMQLECQLASNGIYVGTPKGYADPRRTALEAGADDWRLLLQIDSDDNLGVMWGDCGRVYFWIKEQDLKRQDFDNVWLVLQCC